MPVAAFADERLAGGVHLAHEDLAPTLRDPNDVVSSLIRCPSGCPRVRRIAHRTIIQRGVAPIISLPGRSRRQESLIGEGPTKASPGVARVSRPAPQARPEQTPWPGEASLVGRLVAGMSRCAPKASNRHSALSMRPPRRGKTAARAAGKLIRLSRLGLSRCHARRADGKPPGAPPPPGQRSAPIRTRPDRAARPHERLERPGRQVSATHSARVMA